jgi:prepilin-type N-terminal cleavage/methylation domain-containing protein
MKRKGFTLIELLVVIAIIALLMGILMPALNSARQLAERLACGAQLKGVGNAMAVYAVDHKDDYPRAGGQGATWSPTGKIARWFEYTGVRQADEDKAFRIRRDRTTGEVITPGQATITASFYLLVKYASVTPGQFICKGDGAKEFKLPAEGPASMLRFEDVWDFGDGSSRSTGATAPPGTACSYAYNMPYNWSGGPGGNISLVINDSFNPGIAIAADRNPHLDNRAMDDTSTDRNSAAHQDKGQNVLYKDNSVEWREDPTFGLDGDNIYTRGGSEESRYGVQDGTIPTGNGDGGPHGIPDSYLVSEKNFLP